MKDAYLLLKISTQSLIKRRDIKAFPNQFPYTKIVTIKTVSENEIVWSSEDE
jgi:hypothetical protein